MGRRLRNRNWRNSLQCRSGTGEVLEGELPVGPTEEREESEQGSSVLIMRRQLSPDQSREINHFAGGWSLAKDRVGRRARWRRG